MPPPIMQQAPEYIQNPIGRAVGQGIGEFVNAYAETKKELQLFKAQYDLKKQEIDLARQKAATESATLQAKADGYRLDNAFKEMTNRYWESKLFPIIDKAAKGNGTDHQTAIQSLEQAIGAASVAGVFGGPMGAAQALGQSQAGGISEAVAQPPMPVETDEEPTSPFGPFVPLPTGSGKLTWKNPTKDEATTDYAKARTDQTVQKTAEAEDTADLRKDKLEADVAKKQADNDRAWLKQAFDSQMRDEDIESIPVSEATRNAMRWAGEKARQISDMKMAGMATSQAVSLLNAERGIIKAELDAAQSNAKQKFAALNLPPLRQMPKEKDAAFAERVRQQNNTKASLRAVAMEFQNKADLAEQKLKVLSSSMDKLKAEVPTKTGKAPAAQKYQNKAQMRDAFFRGEFGDAKDPAVKAKVLEMGKDLPD